MSSKNKLTLFIFIALILGVAVGYYLNINNFNQKNTAIVSADVQVKKIESQMSNLKDTTVSQYAVLKTQKAKQNNRQQTRQDKKQRKRTVIQVLEKKAHEPSRIETRIVQRIPIEHGTHTNASASMARWYDRRGKPAVTIHYVSPH